LTRAGLNGIFDSLFYSLVFPVNSHAATTVVAGAVVVAAGAGVACSFLAATGTSPLQIQHLIPNIPYKVLASENP
jgi:pyrroline-5-carboxylate reductase